MQTFQGLQHKLLNAAQGLGTGFISWFTPPPTKLAAGQNTGAGLVAATHCHQARPSRKPGVPVCDKMVSCMNTTKVLCCRPMPAFLANTGHWR